MRVTAFLAFYFFLLLSTSFLFYLAQICMFVLSFKKPPVLRGYIIN